MTTAGAGGGGTLEVVRAVLWQPYRGNGTVWRQFVIPQRHIAPSQRRIDTSQRHSFTGVLFTGISEGLFLSHIDTDQITVPARTLTHRRRALAARPCLCACDSE